MKMEKTRTVRARAAWLAAIVLGLSAGVVAACQAESPLLPAGCPGQLPPGVVVDYGTSGGYATPWTQTTVFEDGRVVEDSETDHPKPRGRVPVAQVEKLRNDLTRSGVFATPRRACPPEKFHPDQEYEIFAVRDSGGVVHIYQTQCSSAPAAIQDGVRDLVSGVQAERKP